MVEEKKNGKGKEGKYLEEENILRREIFGPRRRRSTKKEKEGSFGEGKLMVTPTG